jgi:hypothetical protein
LRACSSSRRQRRRCCWPRESCPLPRPGRGTAVCQLACLRPDPLAAGLWCARYQRSLLVFQAGAQLRQRQAEAACQLSAVAGAHAIAPSFPVAALAMAPVVKRACKRGWVALPVWLKARWCRCHGSRTEPVQFQPDARRQPAPRATSSAQARAHSSPNSVGLSASAGVSFSRSRVCSCKS